MIRYDLPDDKALAKKIIDAEAERANLRTTMGWLGIAFGDVTHKPGNIARFAMILATAMILIAMAVPQNVEIPRREIFILFGGVFTSALGFLFGKKEG